MITLRPPPLLAGIFDDRKIWKKNRPLSVDKKYNLKRP